MPNPSSAAAVASHTHPVRLFRITDIPDVMQHRLGWRVAAQLLRRWFRSPRYVMPWDIKNGDIDPRTLSLLLIEPRIVTMKWALRFGRVRSAYQKLLEGWRTPAGLALLRTRLDDTRPSFQPASWRFGDLSQSGRVLDKTCQVNVAGVGGIFDPLDDFYGAIGKGLLKIAVTGMVTALPGSRYRIAIDEVGIYLRDTYDFNDDHMSLISQPLGYWGFQGVSRRFQLRWDVEIDARYAEAVPADRLYAVQNDDFRRYRNVHGRGGDFVVYSDVQRVRLPRPLILDV
jgi:hypothetical protein